MEKKKVISYKSLPVKPAKVVWSFAIVYLLLEHFNAASWIYGLLIGIYSFLFFVALLGAIFYEKQIDIFNDNK